MVILLVLLLLCVPSVGLAAYQNPTVLKNDATGDGGAAITFQFAGNAGEPIVVKVYTVQQNSTVTALRNWVDDTIVELNLLFTAKTLPSLQPGQTVPRLARTPPVPTAKQVWLDKLERYKNFKDTPLAVAGYTNAVAALKADLEATYQNGFID
jgi:hypothetical protein